MRAIGNRHDSGARGGTGYPAPDEAHRRKHDGHAERTERSSGSPSPFIRQRLMHRRGSFLLSPPGAKSSLHRPRGHHQTACEVITRIPAPQPVSARSMTFSRDRPTPPPSHHRRGRRRRPKQASEGPRETQEASGGTPRPGHGEGRGPGLASRTPPFSSGSPRISPRTRHSTSEASPSAAGASTDSSTALAAVFSAAFTTAFFSTFSRTISMRMRGALSPLRLPTRMSRV